jgi:hypothetical protein
MIAKKVVSLVNPKYVIEIPLPKSLAKEKRDYSVGAEETGSVTKASNKYVIELEGASAKLVSIFGLKRVVVMHENSDHDITGLCLQVEHDSIGDTNRAAALKIVFKNGDFAMIFPVIEPAIDTSDFRYREVYSKLKASSVRLFFKREDNQDGGQFALHLDVLTHDDKTITSAYYPHCHDRSSGSIYDTIPVSCQAGCSVGCTFCYVPRPKIRDLTPDEVVGQIKLVKSVAEDIGQLLALPLSTRTFFVQPEPEILEPETLPTLISERLRMAKIFNDPDDTSRLVKVDMTKDGEIANHEHPYEVLAAVTQPDWVWRVRVNTALPYSTDKPTPCMTAASTHSGQHFMDEYLRFTNKASIEQVGKPRLWVSFSTFDETVRMGRRPVGKDGRSVRTQKTIVAGHEIPCDKTPYFSKSAHRVVKIETTDDIFKKPLIGFTETRYLSDYSESDRVLIDLCDDISTPIETTPPILRIEDKGEPTVELKGVISERKTMMTVTPMAFIGKFAQDLQNMYRARGVFETEDPGLIGLGHPKRINLTCPFTEDSVFAPEVLSHFASSFHPDEVAVRIRRCLPGGLNFFERKSADVSGRQLSDTSYQTLRKSMSDMGFLVFSTVMSGIVEWFSTSTGTYNTGPNAIIPIYDITAPIEYQHCHKCGGSCIFPGINMDMSSFFESSTEIMPIEQFPSSEIIRGVSTLWLTRVDADELPDIEDFGRS